MKNINYGPCGDMFCPSAGLLVYSGFPCRGYTLDCNLKHDRFSVLMERVEGGETQLQKKSISTESVFVVEIFITFPIMFDDLLKV